LSTVTVIGYGNSLRRDDAAGIVVAERLRERYEGRDDIAVIACLQLTPELAETAALSALTVFVDASASGLPGDIRRLDLDHKAKPAALGHELDPAALLALARSVYDREPPAALFTIAGEDFGLGEGLTPAVAAAVDTAIIEIARLIDEFPRTASR